MKRCTSEKTKRVELSCLLNGWLLRACKMESSLRSQMWWVQSCDSCVCVTLFSNNPCPVCVLWSGHLEWPPGKCSVEGECPTQESVPWHCQRCWIQEREWKYPIILPALRKCQLITEHSTRERHQLISSLSLVQIPPGNASLLERRPTREANIFRTSDRFDQNAYRNGWLPGSEWDEHTFSDKLWRSSKQYNNTYGKCWSKLMYVNNSSHPANVTIHTKIIAT